MKSISQSEIRLYQKCPYAYYLQNIRELCWPVEDNTVKKDIGTTFHFMMRQKLNGIPVELILSAETDDSVKALFTAFLENDPIGSFSFCRPEQKAAVPMHNILWTGVFDALVSDGETLTIYDWKTGKRRDPKVYETDPQTVLYRWLAASIGGRFFGKGKSFLPEAVRMVYWFPSDPKNPIELPYSADAFAKDRKKMRLWGDEMSKEEESAFPKTADTKKCMTCRFKLYCHRTIISTDFTDTPTEELPEYDSQFALWELSDEDERIEISF